MLLLIIAIFTTLAAGLALKFVASTGVFDELGYGAKRITWIEYLIGAAVCALVVVPLTAVVGNKLALANNLTFHEYWNGYETEALRGTTECHKNGSCKYHYDCDPHQVTEYVTVPDADGKGTHTEARTHTEYDECPEATEEWDFTVRTTLGDFFVETTFADNPTPFRGDSVRGDVRRGAPPFWQAAADRIARGDPGPVTVRKDYENYILASQSTILHKFSSQLAQYKSMLPRPATGVHDFYNADKVYFVGLDAQPGWQDAVMRFNAGFGSDLQGDLHVMIVNATAVGNPDDFTGALNAYWTSPELGRDAISKNALVVVLGTDGTKVSWARAFTGMPRGNESLLADIQRELKDDRLDPAEILGHPSGVLDGDKIVGVSGSTGDLESQIWGTHPFARVCMTCKQEGGGGFTYLGSEIQMTAGQKWLTVAAATFISLIVWALLIAIGTGESNGTGRRNRTGRYLG